MEDAEREKKKIKKEKVKLLLLYLQEREIFLSFSLQTFSSFFLSL